MASPPGFRVALTEELVARVHPAQSWIRSEPRHASVLETRSTSERVTNCSPHIQREKTHGCSPTAPLSGGPRSSTSKNDAVPRMAGTDGSDCE